MQITPTSIAGVYVINTARIEDERGYFARTFCQQEFAAAGLDPVVAQCSTAHTHRGGTVRGMHFQLPPAAEVKLVRCVRGAIYDVAVDLRPGSPTFCQWFGVELSAGNGAMLYVPKGCAHGMQTLTDDADVVYQMSEFYAPDLARGVRWNDPRIAISWPLPVTVASSRDMTYPDLVHELVASLSIFED